MSAQNSPISSIMTANPVSVAPDDLLISVKHIFEKQDFHHHIPVCENGKLVGMISLIDFVRQLKGSSLDDSDKLYSEMKAADIMSINTLAVSPDTSIHEVAQILAKGDVHALAVTENGILKGIVSTADIIRFFIS